MLKAFSSLILDQSCYGCGKNLIIQEKMVCFECLGQMQGDDSIQRPMDNELYYRLAGKVPLDGAASMYYFDKAGRLQRLIQHIKYKDAMMLARHLGSLWGQQLRDGAFCEADTQIIAVPLHWRRRWQRGYNQAAEIGKGMAAAMDLKQSDNILKRKAHTRTQTRLSGQARWKNVSEAFTLTRKPPRRILLVDDVITTGATLEACIRVLAQHPEPPEKIYVSSLAIARKH
ncbi:MAG: ComF family protein [Bacteroidota bacterium]